MCQFHGVISLLSRKDISLYKNRHTISVLYSSFLTRLEGISTIYLLSRETQRNAKHKKL